MQGKIPAMTRSAQSSTAHIRPNTSLVITAGYYLAFLALGATAASLGPTLSTLASRTGVTLSTVSILFTVRSLGYILGSAAGGRAVDRLPGNRFLAVMVFIMAGMMMLVPFIPLFIVLNLVLFVVGAAEGALDVSTNTLLVWLHHRKVAPFLNGLHFFFGLGALISPFIVGQVIIATGDVAWAYWLLGAAMLPAALLLLPLPSPTPPEGQAAGKASSARLPLIFLAAGVLIFYVGAESGYGGWVFNYARDQVGVGTAVAAGMTSVFWASLTVGRLVSIPVTALLRPSVVLYLDYALCLISTGILAIYPESRTALWVGTIGLGFGMASIFPTVLALAERRMGITGESAGWLFIGGGLGGMTLPWLVGQFFESRGPGSLLFFVACGLILGVALLSVTLRLSSKTPGSEVKHAVT